MVELLERWGNLPEGASELTKNDTLKGATRDQLKKFAEEIGEAVATEHILKETSFDLENIKWPTIITIYAKDEKGNPGPEKGIYNLPGMVDRIGRIYFRADEVDPAWFVPGYWISRSVFVKDQQQLTPVSEIILETTPLYAGEQVIAIQVTTKRINVY